MTQKRKNLYKGPLISSKCPENMGVTFKTDIGTIKSAEPTKIQIDVSKPLPKLPQYPLKPEASPV